MAINRRHQTEWFQDNRGNNYGQVYGSYIPTCDLKKIHIDVQDNILSLVYPLDRDTCRRCAYNLENGKLIRACDFQSLMGRALFSQGLFITYPPAPEGPRIADYCGRSSAEDY